MPNKILFILLALAVCSMAIFAAGCTASQSPAPAAKQVSAVPQTQNAPPAGSSAAYSAGDIVGNTMYGSTKKVLILSYDPSTDLYQREDVYCGSTDKYCIDTSFTLYRNPDCREAPNGDSVGLQVTYRMKCGMMSRNELESKYPYMIRHVSLSDVQYQS